MLYVPIRVYPNELSVKACVLRAAIFLGIAGAVFLQVQQPGLRLAILGICAVGVCVYVVSAIAAKTRQPMLKVMDDRFSVYTPFGYAMVRFGEVVAFRKGGLPGMYTLRVDVNRSTRARFSSYLGRLLYTILWFNYNNSVAIHGYMLGAELEPLIQMLENRRQAAVRLESIDAYDPKAATHAG